MVSVALLLTLCVLGYFMMKICLAVIKAGERAIEIVQAPGRNAGEQRVEQGAERRINSIEMSPAQIHRNAYERRVRNRPFSR